MSLLQTAIAVAFLLFPLATKRSNKALQAGLVALAFSAHIYCLCHSLPPTVLQIIALPLMIVPLLYSFGFKPA